ncbi:hypothetical protein M413DRAFT_442449 [Hebeloma cylindrosporum]|uniref:Uncharacterized protein n=1 Tax=Hebeloma cylindrosporum TaxID=76867 RepID=A0A0C2YTW7_HEBCY|nr:hypothetical protein M413DRAFT_442449 [Hebeloma cylindrosporum h7]
MAEVNATPPLSKTLAEESTSSKNVFNTEAQGKRTPYSPTSSFVFTHLPGFTHFISQRNPSNPDKIFASALFAAGHGYALFYPETILNLDDDFRDTRGISLGDVGVLMSDNQFFFAFNIFLPADHLYNKGNVPESFLPLSPLQDSEVCTTADYFPPGYVVASKGVKVARHSEDPLHITFSSSERRGACMVLPKGATRHDISRSSARVFDYIADNAASWARHIARSDYSEANGSPYVVTGVDKTSVCSNLAFPARSPSVNMSATYQNGSLRPTERMSIARGASAPEKLSPLPNNLCAFMRGIRIALGRTEWVENVDDRPEEETFYTEIFVDMPRLKLPFLNTIVWGKDEQAQSLSEKSYFCPHAFHPSDIAAQIMLCMDPDDATAALVDDFIWSNISQAESERQTEVQRHPLTFICTRGCAFDDLVSMFRDIFDMHQVIRRRGELRPSCTMRLIPHIRRCFDISSNIT